VKKPVSKFAFQVHNLQRYAVAPHIWYKTNSLQTLAGAYTKPLYKPQLKLFYLLLPLTE
jgi:hypothetical protein